MKNNIGQGARHSPQYLLISRAPYTGKPAKLKKDKVPKFSHIEDSRDLRKRPLPLGNGLLIWWRFRDSNPGPVDYDYNLIHRTEHYTLISIGRQGDPTKKYLTVYLTRNTINEPHY